jgi:peptidoglycan LD-endopeptidase LytH
MKRLAFAAGALSLCGLAWIAAGRTPNGGELGVGSGGSERAESPTLRSSTIDSRPSRSATSLPLPTPYSPLPESEPPRPLTMPVLGIDPSSIHDTFDEMRGGATRRHDALDILAPRDTPVVATDDGTVKKLFTSVAGGLTVYQYDPDQRYCYYYAHLDAYAPGLHEGQILHRGDLLGYVGTTGNAAKDTPHLHFAVIHLDLDKRWWTGMPIDPYPLLYRSR